jgi:hypothetical protein
MKKRKSGDGYATLAGNIRSFVEVGELPMPLNDNLLNNNDGIEMTLKKNFGKWHKKCSLAFNKTKLLRAQKRKLKIVENDDETLNTKR